MTEPQPLADADLLAWAVVLEYRRQQQKSGITILLLPYPPCPACGGDVHGDNTVTVERGFRRESVITLRPCQHQFTADDEAIDGIWTHYTAIMGDLDDADRGRRKPGSWVPEHWRTDHVIQQARARFAQDDGPSVQEAAAADRVWDLEKAGE